MTLEALVMAMLVALPGATPAHSEDISNAIAEASGGDQLLAAEVIATGYFESGFLDRIQAGKCRRDECDHGRARGFWQLQRTSYSRDSWDAVLGLDYDAILTGSKVAATILRAGHRACHSTEGAISYFALGRCKWSGARYRAKLVVRLMSVSK